MASDSPQRVLVAGGTGGTGRWVVHRLGMIPLLTRVFTRDRRRAGKLGPVEVVEGSVLSQEDCTRAVDGCQAVICSVALHRTRWKGPSVDGDGVIHLARAADRAGVQRFILVSALGAGESWAPLPPPVKGLLQVLHLKPILVEKTRAEEHLRSSRLAWTILRPGFLHGGPMRSAPLLTVKGRAPGLCGRQALADVTVRCLSTANAIGRLLTIADGWLRCCLRGESFLLDVPWRPWS
jgi:uncharacterized protein YbjT (DUF2867 family)